MKMKNMGYMYSRPTSISFDGRGLFGYTFGPLNQKDVEMYYIEVEKGHDTFMISKKIYTNLLYSLRKWLFHDSEPQIRCQPWYARGGPTDRGIFLFRKDETHSLFETALVFR